MSHGRQFVKTATSSRYTYAGCYSDNRNNLFAVAKFDGTEYLPEAYHLSSRSRIHNNGNSLPRRHNSMTNWINTYFVSKNWTFKRCRPYNFSQISGWIFLVFQCRLNHLFYEFYFSCLLKTSLYSCSVHKFALVFQIKRFHNFSYYYLFFPVVRVRIQTFRWRGNFM